MKRIHQLNSLSKRIFRCCFIKGPLFIATKKITINYTREPAYKAAVKPGNAPVKPSILNFGFRNSYVLFKSESNLECSLIGRSFYSGIHRISELPA